MKRENGLLQALVTLALVEWAKDERSLGRQATSRDHICNSSDPRFQEPQRHVRPRSRPIFDCSQIARSRGDIPEAMHGRPRLKTLDAKSTNRSFVSQAMADGNIFPATGPASTGPRHQQHPPRRTQSPLFHPPSRTKTLTPRYFSLPLHIPRPKRWMLNGDIQVEVARCLPVADR